MDQTIIIDLKTGAKARWHALQTAAYNNLDCFNEGLTFNEEDHVYYVDGVRWPGVTEILADGGAIPKFSTFSDYKRELGSVVHLEALKYPNIELSDLDERVLPYIMSLAEWMEKSKFVIHHQERRGYTLRGYCGTYDVSGFLPEHPHMQRGTLYLQSDGSMAKLDVHTDMIDHLYFLGFLNVWKWKHL